MYIGWVSRGGRDSAAHTVVNCGEVTRVKRVRHGKNLVELHLTLRLDITLAGNGLLALPSTMRGVLEATNNQSDSGHTGHEGVRGTECSAFLPCEGVTATLDTACGLDGPSLAASSRSP